MTILLLLLLFQLPIPNAVDHSQDKTHKAKHERTPFYKKDGKTLCGYMVEFKSGVFYDYLDGRQSPSFDTRAEAEKWMKIGCPVEGKQGTVEK